MTAIYETTELGPFPGDWVETTIGAFQPFVTSGSRGWAAYYSDHGDLFIRIGNMTRSSISLELEDSRFVCLPATGHEGARTQLQPGDLLVSVTADIGIISCIDHAVPSPAYINQHVALVRLPSNAVSPQFVAYFLAHYPSQRRFRAITDQGAKAGINLATVRDIPVVIPPTKAEQEAIAEALRDADALIVSLEQLIAKKRQLKHGAMQELLTGQKRLPGFNGNWEVRRLGEIGEALIGLTYSPSEVRESGVLVLRSSNIQDNKLNFEDNIFVEAEIPERIFVRPGDILVCVRNGSRDLIGKCAILDESTVGMTFGAFMAVFRTPYSSFVYQLFQSDALKRQIHEHLGATINQITNKSLRSFVIPFPLDEREQFAIATILTDMESEIVAVEKKLFKARHLKQGMMQELLTGRTRLV